MRMVVDGLTPDAFFVHRLWPSCRITMLWVTDDPIWGGFGPSNNFHLGQVLRTLAPDVWSPIQFDITTAHRQDEATCMIPQFRFDEHDLSAYSQIWLFGIETKVDPLTDAELNALARFMNRGGGLFATGDHQSLGKPLAGRVPRARSMRRWFYPDAGPNGEPVAPSQSGDQRLDTIADTDPKTPGVQGEQTDAVPQTIRPRLYQRASGAGLFHHVIRYPHPVLCGRSGPITYLPDHMHEGICEVPADLTRTFPLDGVEVPEYPQIEGVRQTPEVIAYGTSQDTQVEQFGVLAAYDGHAAGVGRVLVDSTWHHWFNINLFGFVNATNPNHPTYDPAVIPKWEDIRTYFRNVPLWLADPDSQRRASAALWLCALTHADVRITYRDRESARDRVLYYWQLGTCVADALRFLATGCEVLRLLLGSIDWLDFRLDPWDQRGATRPRPPSWLDLRSFETVALGGAADRLLDAQAAAAIRPSAMDLQPAELLAVARQGTTVSTTAFLRRYVASAEDAERLVNLAPDAP